MNMAVTKESIDKFEQLVHEEIKFDSHINEWCGWYESATDSFGYFNIPENMRDIFNKGICCGIRNMLKIIKENPEILEEL